MSTCTKLQACMLTCIYNTLAIYPLKTRQTICDYTCILYGIQIQNVECIAKRKWVEYRGRNQFFDSRFLTNFKRWKKYIKGKIHPQTILNQKLKYLTRHLEFDTFKSINECHENGSHSSKIWWFFGWIMKRAPYWNACRQSRDAIISALWYQCNFACVCARLNNMRVCMCCAACGQDRFCGFEKISQMFVVYVAMTASSIFRFSFEHVMSVYLLNQYILFIHVLPRLIF